jgi:hypothetical protein
MGGSIEEGRGRDGDKAMSEEAAYTNMPEKTYRSGAGKPVAEEGKYKSIPAILPLAPGGVYAVKWETREKWAEPLKILPVEYSPPLGAPNPSNPLVFFEMRAGGYYLGRVGTFFLHFFTTIFAKTTVTPPNTPPNTTKHRQLMTVWST